MKIEVFKGFLTGTVLLSQEAYSHAKIGNTVLLNGEDCGRIYCKRDKSCKIWFRREVKIK